MEKPRLDGRQRVIIESVTPEVDGGRFPAKRTVGDSVVVEADIFTDGHDSISSVLLYKHKSEAGWHEVPMEFLVNDRWTGEFTVSELGRYSFTIHAWVDHWITWRKDLQKRIKIGRGLRLSLPAGQRHDADIEHNQQVGMVERGGSAGFEIRCREPDRPCQKSSFAD